MLRLLYSLPLIGKLSLILREMPDTGVICVGSGMNHFDS